MPAAMGPRDGLGAMPLYVNLHRIYNELAEAGVAAGAPLTPEQIFPFDQIHYHGTDAVRDAANALQLTKHSRVLEIGSGLGGPARFLAHTTGCHVTGLDVQQDMHALATELTARCGLADRVSHVLGDALAYPYPEAGFDAVVSWLAVHQIPDRPRLFERLRHALKQGGSLYIEDLHARAPFQEGDALAYPYPEAGFDAVVSWLAVHQIPDRPRLFERLRHALKQGGSLYIEDLHARAPFQEGDVADVNQLLYGVTMTPAADYERELAAAGFTGIALTDMTDDWSAFCAGRAAAWKSQAERHVRVHGIETYARLEGFFRGVQRLFEHGSLGGVRVVARAS